ncbi:MAG: hypothetical protein Q8M29_12790 [Bacteroidota bacterium]|nr:hypothetical protein [Bacteroidota bacterium]
MRVTIVFLFQLFSLIAFSQIDTLVIVDRKFPLTKGSIHNGSGRSGSVSLPIEYQKLDNELIVSYKIHSDSSYGIFYEETYPSIIEVKMRELSLDTNKAKHHYLNNFLDTIIIKSEELGKLQPYIKSEKNNAHFISSVTYTLRNDTLTKYYHDNMLEGNIFNHWDMWWNKDAIIKEIKSTTFFVEELYYRRGLTTYYLDRKSIIIAK